MKKGFVLGLLFLAIAALSYQAGAHWSLMRNPPRGLETEWLKREFRLSEEQYAKITALHHAYQPQCAHMCQRIRESNQQLEKLISRNEQLTPEIIAALQQSVQVKRECQQAMLSHIYAISRLMPPEEGQRYIKIMTPLVVQPGHLPTPSHPHAHHH